MTQRFDKDTELMIDALRGIAALLVLVTHTFDLSVVDVYGWDMARSPESWRWARASVGYGGYWVWCFFIISGLCIHQSIARSVAAGTFKWRKYLLARVTRIYPLFLLGLFFAVVAWSLHEDWSSEVAVNPGRQFLASLFSLQIITTPFPSFETSWSLSCEMIYYVAWPAMLLLMRGRASLAVYAGMAASGLTLALVLFFWKGMHRFEQSAAVDGIWTLSVLFPVWLCGAWLAGNWNAISARITRRLWLSSILLCILSECLLAHFKYMQYPGWVTHVTSWASVPGLLIFIGGARHARLSRFKWAEPVCLWFGQFSYPCYILHMQLLLILNHFLKPLLPGFTGGNPMYNFALLLVPLLGSLALIGPRLERLIMRWRASVISQGRVTPIPVIP